MNIPRIGRKDIVLALVSPVMPHEIGKFNIKLLSRYSCIGMLMLYYQFALPMIITISSLYHINTR